MQHARQVPKTHYQSMKSSTKLVLVILFSCFAQIYCDLINSVDEDVIVDDAIGDEYPIGDEHEIVVIGRQDNEVVISTTSKPVEKSKSWIVVVAVVLGVLLLILLCVICCCCCCCKKKKTEKAPSPTETTSAPANTSSANPSTGTKTYPSFDQLQKV